MRNGLFFGLLALAFVSPAGAASSHGGFSKAEVLSVEPLFKSYDLIGLAEVDSRGKPTSMTLAVEINAPREVIFEIFKDPKNYYYLSTLFKENRLLESHDNTLAYSWASRHKFFSFTGENVVSLFPPRRIDIKIAKSTIGNGNFHFNLYKRGKNKTLLVFHGHLNVTSSDWLIRFLVGNSPSMEQAFNLAIGVVVVKGTKSLAERMFRGKKTTKHRTRGKREGGLVSLSGNDVKRIKPLLRRGTVILSSSVRGGKLKQVVTIEELDVPRIALLKAIASPNLYPKMVGSISKVVVHNKKAAQTEFSWNLGFSVFGLKSRNRLTISPKGVDIVGLDGDLKGAQWRWQLVPSANNKTIVAYHGWADVKGTAEVMAKTVKREPYLEHGIMAGSNMVMLRAIRRSVEKATTRKTKLAQK